MNFANAAKWFALGGISLLGGCAPPAASMGRIQQAGASYIEYRFKDPIPSMFPKPVLRFAYANEDLDDEQLLALIEDLRRVRAYHINLDNTKVTDRVMRPLSEIPSLRELLVVNTSVTGAGLAQLSKKTRLKHISVDIDLVSEDEELEIERRFPGLEVKRTNFAPL